MLLVSTQPPVKKLRIESYNFKGFMRGGGPSISGRLLLVATILMIKNSFAINSVLQIAFLCIFLIFLIQNKGTPKQSLQLN